MPSAGETRANRGRMMRSIILSAAASVLLAAAGAYGASAQEQLALAERPPDHFQTPERVEFSDAEVAAFADAIYVAVLVDDDWRSRIAAAETADEANELSREAQREMAAAVRGAGMDLGTFTQIFTYVQVDSALAERVSVAIEDRFGG